MCYEIKRAIDVVVRRRNGLKIFMKFRDAISKGVNSGRFGALA
jgi:hypothetical protein